MTQCESMSETIATFLNSDICEASRGSSNALVRHVADELSWEYSKLKKKEERTAWELTRQKIRVETLKETTIYQKKKIEELTADLKIVLVKIVESIYSL